MVYIDAGYNQFLRGISINNYYLFLLSFFLLLATLTTLSLAPMRFTIDQIYLTKSFSPSKVSTTN